MKPAETRSMHIDEAVCPLCGLPYPPLFPPAKETPFEHRETWTSAPLFRIECRCFRPLELLRRPR